jgi:hypothetical protein
MAAMIPSPDQSPIMGASHRIDRQQSNSPPLQEQQLSKRDKRRTNLANRLAEITAQFSDNRDVHYRNQLQALQIDINLIGEANAQGDMPLPDSPGAIDKLVRDNLQKNLMKAIGANVPLRAGRVYADFAKEINDAMEEKDAMLAMHKVCLLHSSLDIEDCTNWYQRDFEVKLSELTADYAYRQKLASNEYHALSTTLRDRLINSITSKKNRLAKDNASLELGENSNSLLLHPSQFGVANPASPGGLIGKRATRHRRDVDDLPSFTESNKRKRKAHDSDESPAPTRQRIDNGNSTPIWLAEQNALKAVQVDSALYSVEKLFTEKELAMTYNAAALAAHSYMQRQKTSDESDSPPNGKSDSSSENEKAIAAAAEADPEDADSPPGGASMERQYSHATRSTRGVNSYLTGIGIDALGDINYPGTFDALVKQIPKLPPIGLAYGTKTYSNKDPASAGFAAGMTVDDANAEFELIKRARMYNEENGYGKNLERDEGARSLLEVASDVKKRYSWVKSDNKDLLKEVVSSVREEGNENNEAVLTPGGEQMSRQNTGDSMVRTASSRGRIPKARNPV